MTSLKISKRELGQNHMTPKIHFNWLCECLLVDSLMFSSAQGVGDRPIILCLVTSTAATFVSAVDPGTRISFLFAGCRYLSIFFDILLLTN